MEGEVVSQLMDQKDAIEMRDQDPVRMRDVERESDTILCLSRSAESEVLLMDPGRRHDEHLWTGFGGIWGDAHETGDIEIQRVHLLGSDLAVAEIKDIGVESRPNTRAGQILNATEAPLKEKGREYHDENQQEKSWPG